MSDKATELREKAAEFTAARAALNEASALPVVRASAPDAARLDALAVRANKLQTLIEQVGKMVDGARRWFADTFSLDLKTEVPIASGAINAAIQSAIAGMNYFIRDARKELATIQKAQQVFDAADDDGKKKMLGELQAAETRAPAAPSKKVGMIVLAALGLLILLNAKGGERGDET